MSTTHNSAAERALTELVAVKDIKDEFSRLKQRRAVVFGRDPEAVAECERLEADYKRRQPIAWEAARAALQSPAEQPVAVQEAATFAGYLAGIVETWVDLCLKDGKDWRPALASVIERRLWLAPAPAAPTDLLKEIRAIVQDQEQPLGNRLQMIDARVALFMDAEQAAPKAEAADARDAARYRWLRSQYWNSSSLFVVAGSKSQVRLGTDCPNHDRLDAAIDAARDALGKEVGNV
ncbi:hypothetical protein LJR084_001854 [Variovorax sp. LjRoot84]|uniref:hypothetical protein n=1 Tax=Variovorax sp. LjRoot84 TaxID=3342340 RepID=UPI003ED04E70